MTYKFDNLGVEITSPTVTVRYVNDFIEGKECSVIVNLQNDNASVRIQLDGFTYKETWEDEDVISWVNEKLKDYKTE